MAKGQIRKEDLNLVSATSPSDPVILSDLQAAINAAMDNKAYKFPVRVGVTAKNPGDLTFNSFAAGVLSTTSNITVIDGITLAVGDRVLVNNLTGANLPYNGLYVVNSLTGTSQFTRAGDASTAGTGNYTDLQVGSTVIVEDGAVNANTLWILQPPAMGTDTLVLNTSNVKWLQPSVSVPSWFNETPGGTVNGTNAAFTLSRAPITNSLLLFLRRQLVLIGMEFTLSGVTVTFNGANIAVPSTGDDFLAIYQA